MFQKMIDITSKLVANTSNMVNPSQKQDSLPFTDNPISRESSIKSSVTSPDKLIHKMLPEMVGGTHSKAPYTYHSVKTHGPTRRIRGVRGTKTQTLYRRGRIRHGDFQKQKKITHRRKQQNKQQKRKSRRIKNM